MNGGGIGAWDTSTQNWWDGSKDVAWNNANNEVAFFGGKTGTVNLSTGITASAVQFGGAGYSITGNTLTLAGGTGSISVAGVVDSIGSVIAGSTGLQLSGGGTLFLTSANTYTGGTTIGGGTLTLSNQPLPAGSVVINSNATLEYADSTGVTQAAAITISGGGTLLKSGAGILTFGSGAGGNINWQLGAGALIDVEGGILLGGSNIKDVWTSNLSDLTIAAGATFNGVEANVRVNAVSGSGTLASGYAVSAGYSTFTLGVNNGSGTFLGNIVDDDASQDFIANLTKVGTGTEVFSGVNSYSGGTNINGGTLSLGSADAIDETKGISFGGGTLQFSANNTSDYSYLFSTAGNQVISIDTNGQDVDFAHPLTSPGGSLTKLGSGTLTLSGANTYTGATTVNNGALTFSNQPVPSTSISIAEGATLEYAIPTGNTVSQGSTSANTTTTITGGGTLLKSGAGALVFGVGGGGNIDWQLQANADGTHALIDVDGGNLTGGSNILDNWTSNHSDLNIASGAIFNGVEANVVVNALTGTGILASGYAVSAGYRTFTIGVDNGSGTFSGNIIDEDPSQDFIANLTKVGTGTEVLSGLNTYSGSTTISGGTLQIGNGGATGSLGTGLVIDNGSLAFNRASNLTVANPISGSGTLTQNGTGALILTGANSYTGNTTINVGTLQIGNGGAVGSLGTGPVADNSKLAFDLSSSPTVANVISGSGSLTQSGSGTLTLSGGNSYSGGTTISTGILHLGAANVLPGDVTDNAALDLGGFNDTIGAVSGNGTVTNNSSGTAILSVGSTNNNGAFTGAIQNGSGAVALTKTGTGTQILAGNNSYSGNTTISAGILQIGNGGATGSLGNGAVTDNSSLVFALSSDSTVVNVISGSGSLLETAGGTLVFAGANSYSGGTIISQGTLQLNNVTAAGSGSITLGDAKTGSSAVTLSANVASGNFANPIVVSNQGAGVASLRGDQNFLTYSGTLTLNRLTTIDGNATDRFGISGSITGSVGTLTINAPRVTLDETAANANNFAGNVAIDAASTLQMNSPFGLTFNNDVTANGTLQLVVGAGNTATIGALSGAGFLTGDTGGGHYASTLSLGGDNNSGTFLGVITNDQASAGDTLAIVKAGSGAETFSGVNTYGGSTTISSGTLLQGAVGALPSGDVTVNGTLDLHGNSAVLGALNGSGIVTSSAAGAVTLSVGSTNSSGSFSGLVQNGSGAVALTKVGTGTQALTGASSYSGATSVLGGLLLAGGDVLPNTNGPLGNSSSAVAIGASSGSAGAAIYLGAANTFGRPITIQAGSTGVATVGGQNTSGIARFTGALALEKNVVLSDTAGGAAQFTGGFSGPASFSTVGGVSVAPSFSVTAAPAASAFGQSVAFTMTLSAPTNVTPSGTVTFLDGTTLLGTATLNAGSASISTSTLAPGLHTIAADYNGDAEFLATTSSTTETVSETSTTTAVAAAPTASVFGQNVTLTATVSVVAPGTGTPTGAITFLDGSATLGTVNLSNGSASLSTSALTVANHTITASYSGDGNFGASSNTVSVPVSQATTTTALVAVPTTSVFGQAVSFTATVLAAAPGAGMPTGTVTFKDGSTILASAALNGSGMATFTTSSLSVASHTITASYSGDGSFLVSSASAGESVSQANTTTTVTAGPAPSVVGQTVTITATVRAVAPGSGTPTGTATVLDGTAPLGTVALSGGSATWTTSALALGGHTITVDYSGDGNFVLSNGSASEAVGQANTASHLGRPLDQCSRPIRYLHGECPRDSAGQRNADRRGDVHGQWHTREHHDARWLRRGNVYYGRSQRRQACHHR